VDDRNAFDNLERRVSVYKYAVIAFEKSITLLQHNENCSNSNFLPPLVPHVTLQVLTLCFSQHVSLPPLFTLQPTACSFTSSRRDYIHIVRWPHRVYNKLLASFALCLSLSLSLSLFRPAQSCIICINTSVDDVLSTAIEKLSRIS